MREKIGMAWSARARIVEIMLAVALLSAGAPATQAQDAPGAAAPQAQPAGQVVRVALIGGDALRGVIVERTDDAIALEHAALGRITIPASAIASIEAPAPDAAAQPQAPAEPAEPPPAPAERPVTPERLVEKPKSPWSGSVELGLNGSQGNTERTNFRIAAEATRERDRDALYLATLYRTAIEDGETIENRLEMRSRQEWKSAGDVKRWRFFLEETGEIDQFQDYDVRIAAAGGFRYRFISTPETSLIGRIGAGFSRKFGGPDDAIKPEGLLALEAKHKINSRLEIRGFGEIYPDIGDPGEFRSLVRGSLDVKLSNDSSLALRLGAEHRYDSTPGDAKRTDVDYFLTLVYSF